MTRRGQGSGRQQQQHAEILFFVKTQRQRLQVLEKIDHHRQQGAQVEKNVIDQGQGGEVQELLENEQVAAGTDRKELA